MACFLSTFSIHLHNQEVINLKTFVAQGFDFQTTNYDMINKYTIYNFNHKYAKMNIKNYCF